LAEQQLSILQAHALVSLSPWQLGVVFFKEDWDELLALQVSICSIH
jgi:hypothetical protein